MSATAPRRLGRYTVIELLGIGAFATVFRARDDRLDADVAIKVLAENHSFNPDLRERFISEGHLLRRVDSPHVVKVFDLDETDTGQPFLVLDLAAGGDLVSRRKALGGREPSLVDVLTVATQVAAALGALHAERVVHRDVTPGNLLIHSRTNGRAPSALLGADERLMLADLGLSKDLAMTSGLTMGAGTAGFTPPEQGKGGWVDPRADIWSASALLVWLALGAAPDPAEAWTSELDRLGWPPALVDELERGLATRPEDRHPTAEAWVEALHRAAQPPVPPDPPGEPSAPATSSPDHGRTVILSGGAGRPGADPAPWTSAGPEAARVTPMTTGADPGRRAASTTGRLRWIAPLALVVALLVPGSWWLGRTSAGGADRYGRTRTVRLADGQVRATASRGSAVVAISGPASVRVGERASYTATVEGVASSRWLAPDGRSYENEPTLFLEPRSDGTTTVRLLGQSGDGDVVVAELRVTVRA